MVWLNREHHNTSSPPHGFGGSMCVCSKCQTERVLARAVDHVECKVQIEKIVDELPVLADMLNSPYKKEKLSGIAAMLRDWAKNMEVEA